MAVVTGLGGQGESVAIVGEILHGGERKTGTVVLAGGVIAELAIGRVVRPPRGFVYEFADGLILPGLIDLHVHGGGGHAVWGGRAELAAVGRHLASQGVTGFLASVPALAWDDLTVASQMIAGTCAAGVVPNLLGLHLEGPHLNPERAGSQDRACLRPVASLADYLALRAAAGTSLKMLTIAPELPGAIEVIEACRRDGVVAALGHSDALYEQAKRGIAAGVTHVTHLFNAMRPFHQREPGALGAALTAPGITAELILDGEHVHQGAWELARRALGPRQMVLVSDALPCATAGAAAPPARQQWLGKPVFRRGRRLELADGTLAGSDIALPDAVRTAIGWGASAAEAVASATEVPAAAIGLGQRKGRLLPGFAADVTVVDREWRPCLTIVGGRRVWPE